jgi:hypothetical protein
MAMSLGIGLGMPFGGPAASGAAPVTFQATSRPSSPTIAKNVTTAGDSTVVGVGTQNSPTDYSWPGQAVGLATVTFLRKEVSGMSVQTGGTGLNTSPIATQITGQGATPLANNHQFFTGGLNDYNTGVQTEPNLRLWDVNIPTVISGTILPSFTGGTSQWWTYFDAHGEDDAGPGMKQWASWRYMHRSLQATYGAHIFDIRRYIQFVGAQQGQSGVGVTNLNQFWGKPIEYEGQSTDLFRSNPPSTWNWTNTATNTGAGIEAAAPAAGYAEGDIIQNVAAPFNGGGIWRKNASGAWSGTSSSLFDAKHLSRWGYAVWAQVAIDILVAFQGQGAPVPCPAELYCKQDDAAGTTVGTIYYVGSAPATLSLWDASTHAAVTQLTLTDNGSTNGAGSITVTRSSTGSLTEGEMLLDIQLTDASGHVQHGPVDFRIGQPSTQTVPRLWALPYSGESPLTSRTDFSLVGRENNGFSDGATFWGIGWLQPQDMTENMYLLDLEAAHSDNSKLQVYINSGNASLRFTGVNSAGSFVFNGPNVVAFAAGQATWFAFQVDASPATPTIKYIFNKNGAGDNSGTLNGTTGSTTMAFSKMTPRFLSLRDANLWTYAWQFNNARDTNRNQFRGKLGMLACGHGDIGVNSTFNPRTIWNTNGTPVARTPMAAINGVTPVYDIQGGMGDFLNGGFNQTQLVFGTYRGIKGLT